MNAELISQNSNLKIQNHNEKLKTVKCPKCGNEMRENKTIEVGNIFKLGTKFSQAIGLLADDKDGKKVLVEMASYGIGPTRVMGTIVEVGHDEKGIIWGENIAPYDVIVVELRIKNNELRIETQEAISELEKAGLEVLLDDRIDVSVGEKLADADLIGCPWRIIISQKSLDQGGVEIKKRSQPESKIVSIPELIDVIKK